MCRLLMKSVAMAVVVLALALTLTAQTQPAAGKFGLPAAKPAATTTTTPVTANTASAVPTSTAPAGQAPATTPAAVKSIVPGIGIKKVYVTITGAKQQGNIGKMEVSKFQFQPSSARDAASGLPSGRSVNGPILCSKQWDDASIPLLTALENNETLGTVLFEFVGADRTGMETTVFTVKLTNATVAAIHQNLDTTTTAGALEEVQFSYQKIDIQDVKTKQMASANY